MSGHLRTLKSVMSAVNILEPLWDRDDCVLRMEIFFFLFREKSSTRFDKVVVRFYKEEQIEGNSQKISEKILFEKSRFDSGVPSFLKKFLNNSFFDFAIF